jgi:RNase adaptor protein for sRNA GlmZ degradation
MMHSYELVFEKVTPKILDKLPPTYMVEFIEILEDTMTMVSEICIGIGYEQPKDNSTIKTLFSKLEDNLDILTNYMMELTNNNQTLWVKYYYFILSIRDCKKTTSVFWRKKAFRRSFKKVRSYSDELLKDKTIQSFYEYLDNRY